MKKDSKILDWNYYKNKAGIYSITNLSNKKTYIGQSLNIYGRYYGHSGRLAVGKDHCTYLQNAYNKYGKDNFIFSPILVCEKEELERYEMSLIKLYKTQDRQFGYNITPGGKTLSGKDHPMFGKKLSQEHKDKISKAATGDKNCWYGKRPPCISAAIESNSIPVIQLDKQGNFIKEFSSITEAAKEVGIGKSNIAHVCKGDKYRHTAKGYKWEYKTIKANIEIKN